MTLEIPKPNLNEMLKKHPEIYYFSRIQFNLMDKIKSLNTLFLVNPLNPFEVEREIENLKAD